MKKEVLMNQNQKMRAMIDTTVLPYLSELGFSGSYPRLEKEENGVLRTVCFHPADDGCSFTVTVNDGKKESALPGTYGGAFRFGVLYRKLSFSPFPFSYRGADPEDENGISKKWYETKILSGNEEMLSKVAQILCRQLEKALK